MTPSIAEFDRVEDAVGGADEVIIAFANEDRVPVAVVVVHRNIAGVSTDDRCHLSSSMAHTAKVRGQF
jgi:hypothetical protein